MPSTEDLIDELTEGLTERRSVSPRWGRILLAAVALLTIALVVGMFGMRGDFAAGHAEPVSLISALIVLAVGTAVSAALTAMARPAVGAQRNGWQWTVVALAVLPAAALLTAISSQSARAEMWPEGPPCLIVGSLASIASIVALT
jgi:hypothetical protein